MMLASSAPLIAQSSAPPPQRNDDCSSSTSPTNTTASDGSSMEMLTTLMNGGTVALPTAIKQESPPLNTSPLFNPEFALLQISQLMQAQHAMAQYHSQKQQQQQQMVQQQQQQAQQSQSTTNGERKRSYPCTFQFCVICQKDVHSSKLPCHIRQCHVAKPMFQCPACDFTSTYSKNNVKSHMVSLHGLAGDPISYMDKYAGQVEEFMKMCFPNVRGRGRPMQGRTSPKSPVSPTQRRGSQAALPNRRNTVSQSELLATLQQQQAAFNPLRNLRFNPLQSIFPGVLANNNNNSILAANKQLGVNNFLIKQELEEPEDAKPTITSTTPPSPPLTPSIEQPVKPGENAQPKYLNAPVPCTILNDLQMKGTIFADCRHNIELYLENISRKIESGSGARFVLTEQQRQWVEETRARCSVQLFEVLFSIHRMEVSKLDLSLVELLLRIAPTKSDAQLLRRIESHTDPNEEFLMGLTNVDHIEEKLETMKHMHMFPVRVEAVNERMRRFEAAVKALRESRALRNVLQLVLAILNIAFFDDKQCLSVNGFSCSEINTILATATPSGQTVQSILSTILKDEINLDLDELFALIGVLEKVEHEEYTLVAEELIALDDMTLRAEREMEHSGSNVPLSEFVENAKTLSKSMWEAFGVLKTSIQKLTAYLGNTLPRHHDPSPEPFRNVLQMLRSLKTSIEMEETADEQHINILSP